MKTFQLNILQADSPFYTGPCESLTVPTPQGKYGILANHINIIIAVVPGKLSYKVPGGETEIAAVSHGIVKVENNKVLMLVDSAEHPDEIDINRVKREADEAKEAMLQKRSVREYRLAEANLARAIASLKVKDNYDSMINKADY